MLPKTNMIPAKRVSHRPNIIHKLPNQPEWNQKLLVQKELFLCSAFFIAPWTLLLAFSFLLFQMGANRKMFHGCFKVER